MRILKSTFFIIIFFIICEIIIGANEIDYTSCEESQKTSFINQKKLEIASSVIGHEKYSKEFSQSLIQNGFQSKNVFSSILYLNEYYKSRKCYISIHFIVDI